MYMNLFLRCIGLCIVLSVANSCFAHSINESVAKLKPSVVGVGLYDAMGTQTHRLQGTGFAFANGSYIATNYHVVSSELDTQIVQYRIVFSGQGAHPVIHKADVIAIDPLHDLAILKIEQKLPPVKLARDEFIADGSEVALTGFPIGAILGLYPATHRGIVAALTPDVIPSVNSNQLTINMLERLKTPFLVYQLDITAYPGNSGSPVYNTENNEVIAVLNKVFIKESKEAVLEKPSGISYAIPINHLIQLASEHSIKL